MKTKILHVRAQDPVSETTNEKASAAPSEGVDSASSQSAASSFILAAVNGTTNMK